MQQLCRQHCHSRRDSDRSLLPRLMVIRMRLAAYHPRPVIPDALRRVGCVCGPWDGLADGAGG